MLIDQKKFLEARARAEVCSLPSGIGTLAEKLLHRTLKYYFEPDESRHEIEIFGSVCDVYGDKGIIEIQTRSFHKLIPKLEKFLPDNKVTVVFPIIENKRICQIDVNTGESLPIRKSPRKGLASDILPELWEIKNYFTHENLKIFLVFLDVLETRMLNGELKIGRKKTKKLDSIPTSINSITELSSKEDFILLLPRNLPREFTAKEFERFSHLRGIKAHNSLMLLMELGIIAREKRGGRAFVYFVV